MTLLSPDVPRSRLAPVPIGPDTYLLGPVRQVPDARRWVWVNSMVVTGTEPVIVASGSVAAGGEWPGSVFDVVEPADVRWIYLSGDEFDLAGGLAEVMRACPNAALVADRAALHRHIGVPTDRCRWVDDGESFAAGDRHLLAVRAPAFGAPGSRALLDQRTGIYWAADTFGCLLSDRSDGTVAELDPELWADGMALFAHHLPGQRLDLVDHRRFAALCDRTRALGMTTIAAAHSPLITDTSIDDAFRLLRDLPGTNAPTTTEKGPVR